MIGTVEHLTQYALAVVAAYETVVRAIHTKRSLSIIRATASLIMQALIGILAFIDAIAPDLKSTDTHSGPRKQEKGHDDDTASGKQADDQFRVSCQGEVCTYRNEFGNGDTELQYRTQWHVNF